MSAVKPRSAAAGGGRSPLVVAGMHRSGTSLIAAYLAAQGLDLGRDPEPPTRANPRGYGEDGEFRALNRRILHCLAGDDAAAPSHPDWGWTPAERLDASLLPAFRPAAAALVASRLVPERPWGFKDPRAALLLDFWDGVLGGQGRYLLLYRFPWDVADSMQRLGATVFLSHPDCAYRIWTFYNRALLDFHRRHRDRVVLASTNAALREPERLAQLVRVKLGLPLAGADFASLREPGLFREVGGEDPLIRLVATTSPGVVELLGELDGAADLPARGLWGPPAAPPVAPGRATAPRLSVVLPCRDHGSWLVEALASVERTVPPPYEALIVDDGSREERTVAILTALARAGYTVLSQPAAGLPAARNRGIAAALGPCIVPLDADNRLRPGFAAAALAILEREADVDVVYGDWEEFGAREGRRSTPVFDLDRLLAGNFIDACAVFRRTVWEACGGFDPAMTAWEDWEFWIHAARRGCGFRRLGTVTFDYRVRPGSLLGATETPEARARLRRHVVVKHADLYRERLPALLEADQQRQMEALAAAREAASRTAAMTREIAAARAESARREQELGELIALLRGEIDRRDELLAAIAASRGWQLLSRYWRLRDRLLPAGSRRRRRFDGLLAALGWRRASPARSRPNPAPIPREAPRRGAV